jgi:hypothetical protein
MKGDLKLSALRPLRLAGLVSAGLAAVFICGCGSSARSLDSVKVERAIATSIVKEHGIYTTVACPAKVPQQAGHVFMCTARLEVGAYPVKAIETNGSGRVSYANQQPLVVLNIAKVQRAIEASIFSQRHLRAAASCPAEVLQRAGLVFSCTARIKGGARSYPFRVSEVDNAGHVRYLAA